MLKFYCQNEKIFIVDVKIDHCLPSRNDGRSLHEDGSFSSQNRDCMQ